MPVSGSGPVVVTAIWDSVEAYRAWGVHPIRAEFPPITTVAEEPTSPLAISNGVYEVALAARRD